MLGRMCHVQTCVQPFPLFLLAYCTRSLCSRQTRLVIAFHSLWVCFGYCHGELGSFARRACFLYGPAVDFHHPLYQIEPVARTFPSSVTFAEKVWFRGVWFTNTIILVDHIQMTTLLLFVVNSNPAY